MDRRAWAGGAELQLIGDIVLVISPGRVRRIAGYANDEVTAPTGLALVELLGIRACFVQRCIVAKHRPWRLALMFIPLLRYLSQDRSGRYDCGHEIRVRATIVWRTHFILMYLTIAL